MSDKLSLEYRNELRRKFLPSRERVAALVALNYTSEAAKATALKESISKAIEAATSVEELKEPILALVMFSNVTRLAVASQAAVEAIELSLNNRLSNGPGE